MKTDILEFVEGAKLARGLAVIIDVFRAFSVECYAYAGDAASVIATGSVEEAFKLKDKYRNSILAGERDELKVEGFDLGNSPTEIICCNLEGKTLIHTTTAGTCGLVNAVNCHTVLAGSLVNASAIAKYILQTNADQVSLVAMGYRARESAEEDILCAEYIRSMLNGESGKFEARIADLRNSAGKRFFNPDNADFSPPSDFFLCTMTNRFGFVLSAERRYDGNMDMRKIDV